MLLPEVLKHQGGVQIVRQIKSVRRVLAPIMADLRLERHNVFFNYSSVDLRGGSMRPSFVWGWNNASFEIAGRRRHFENKPIACVPQCCDEKFLAHVDVFPTSLMRQMVLQTYRSFVLVIVVRRRVAASMAMNCRCLYET